MSDHFWRGVLEAGKTFARYYTRTRREMQWRRTLRRRARRERRSFEKLERNASR